MKPMFEGGVVNDQRRIIDEIHEVLGEFGEERLVGQEFLRQAVHVEGLLRHVAFGIDVDVIELAGRNVVDQFNATDFHQPVAAARV